MRTERPEHAEESAGLAKLAPDREKMTGGFYRPSDCRGLASKSWGPHSLNLD